MMKFDKTNLTTLRSDVNAALAAVAAKHGVKINLGNCRFSPSEANFKLNVCTIGTDGTVVDAEVEALKSAYVIEYVIGTTAKNLDRHFTAQGMTFVLTGYKSRRRAYPFRARDVNTGKTYFLPARIVAAGFRATLVA